MLLTNSLFGRSVSPLANKANRFSEAALRKELIFYLNINGEWKAADCTYLAWRTSSNAGN